MAVQSAVRNAIQTGLVKSAHDCSEGGVAVALAEACFNPDGRLGVECDLSEIANSDATTLFFNEAPSRIVISVGASKVDQVLAQLKTTPNVETFNIGRVVDEEFSIKAAAETLSAKAGDLYDLWWNSIARIIAGESQGDPLPSL
jgi:phosphoribosylformylglycinamidine synthase